MDDASRRLKDLALSDSGFVFDPYTGLTFSVNATGRAILDALKQGATPEAAEERLRASFATTAADDLSRDVREFLLLLRESGILPREG